ncbi:non-ribosomal peptide synthetase [Candidatus Pantoea multigeneris]|uniref:Amino acid adenylation domain-containing protein n=1 Tax=Candidatus Pantoea multigeneris TaxID=2608357 RepID=A0ABX0RBH1_9GAMM|nr:amino acid adenylation domain-containing protein [Pantoea multigeneris]
MQDNRHLPHAESTLTYWSHYLSGVQMTANANLANTTGTDTAKALPSEAQVSTLVAALPSALSAALLAHRLSLDVLLTAAWGLLLSKYSGEEEVAFAVRLDSDVRSGSPLFPVRLPVDGDLTLGEWLNEVADRLAQHRLHADTLPASLPSLTSQVSVQEKASADETGAPLQVTLQCGSTLSLALRYHLSDISDADAQSLLHRLQQLLTDFTQGNTRLIREQSLLGGEDIARILHAWNDTALDVALDRSLYALFADQVAARRSSTALVADDRRISYQQLADRAGEIATALRRAGVVQGDRLVLSMNKSPDLIAAMLAIIKLGAAYVPVSLDTPFERRAFITHDAQARWTLTTRADVEHFTAEESARLLFVDEFHGAASAPEDAADAVDSSTIAYIIYTSGTTGTPKGVAIAHRSLINFCAWCEHLGIFSAGQPITQFAPYTFDASAGEIFGTLTRGCELHLLSNALIQNPPALTEYMAEHNVRFSAFPPPYLAHLDPTRVPEGMTLLTAGSAPTLSLIERWSERCRYINGYGPTETTIMSSAWMRDSEPTQDNRLSIGRPIANTRMYVVDHFGQLCAPGMAGEIWIGGEGVAVGYINRPELTAQQFIADPWVPGARVYRTGDIGRWLDDGRIEFLGRRDHQIKLSGYRIELGDIESHLTALAQIKEATVIGLTPAEGEARLVAYVVPEHPVDNTAIAQWREALARQLPGYMIPAAFVVMKALPLTANGKIDRKALPLPDSSAYVQRDFAAPRAGTETVLAQLWQTLLGVHTVGRQDNFFELGGHSLLAMQLKALLLEQQLYTDVPTILTYPVLAELAAQITPEAAPGAACVVPENLITPDLTALHPEHLPLVSLTQPQIENIVSQIAGGIANIQDIYALTPLQEGIIFHHLLEEGGDPYLQCGHLSFTQRDALDKYLAALQRVVDRHDILRTAFIWQGLETPVQVVLRQARLQVKTLALTADAGAIVEQMKAHLDPYAQRIDLAQPPLLHLHIAYDDAQARWEVLMYIHHLVEDLSSLQILLADTQAFLNGTGDSLPPATAFRQHVAHLRQHSDPQPQLAFFAEMLGDIDAPTMPFLLKSGYLKGQQITETRQRLAAPLAQRLRQQARRLGVSLSSLCHLSWARVLGAASGRDTVVLGTVLSGRMQGKDSDKILGPCLNTLPMRLDVGAIGAVEAVQQTHQRLTALIRHEHAMLSLAQQASGIAPPTPLFSSVFNYRRNRPSDKDILGNIAFDGMSWHGFEERTPYPIVASVDEGDDEIDISVQVLPSLSGEPLVAYFQQSLLSLVTALEADVSPSSTEIALYQLEILPPEVRQDLLNTVNTTTLAFPATTLIHQLFEHQAALQPQALALSVGDAQFSYAELNQQANRLAHYLMALGVTPDTRVGVCVERGATMLIALLATLKAGGAYVPLDPEYPAARLAYILDDAQPKVLLVDQRGSALFGTPADNPVTVVNLDTDRAGWAASSTRNPAPLSLNSRHLAYVIYTSGSTGNPKGVMVEHRQVVNFLTGMQALFRLTPEDCLLSVTSISFDIAGLELYLPLMTGASIRLASRDQARDPDALLSLLRSHRITLMQATPTTWRALVERDATPHPQLKILCGGEAMPADLAQRLFTFGASLWNLYGPTETTIWSTCHRVEEQDLTQYNQAIGTPIANTQVYLMDAHGQPVPKGAMGELYIGGEGVARGYFARPELTAERFIPDPFSTDPAARLYRTGDFATFSAENRLIYLGRTDSQLKLRGHRIELQEIEARLMRHPRVREAVVVAREARNGTQRLVAYVVPQSNEASTATQPVDPARLDFSLFFFGANTDARRGYHEYLKAAEFGDRQGFTAIWTPERHFHNVGGLYANPALLQASLATATQNIQLRAGSVVLPLHDPLSIAENWSIVDNLSNGRVGIGIASGWNPQDFVLAPQNYCSRREVMRHGIEELKTLWHGGSVVRQDSRGQDVAITIYPQPVQRELPIWLTAAGTSETFEYAGSSGANVLTHLLTQNIDGLASHIARYRAARENAGFDPHSGKVTVMVHTCLGDNHDAVLNQARQPFFDYLEGHLSLLSDWLMEQDIDLNLLPHEDKQSMLAFAFKRYTRDLSFIGTPESALSVAEKLQEIGVNEVACLIDWIEPEDPQAALQHLATLKNKVQARFDRQTLRQHLQDTLPDYMVPAAFVTLDTLPLTPNGKIDRNALVTPDDMDFALRTYVAPQGEIETTLAAIWEALLGVERIGRQDNFFELGGYSLLAVRLIEQLRRKGLSIEIRTLFDTPVLADLAAKTIELAETRL